MKNQDFSRTHRSLSKLWSDPPASQTVTDGVVQARWRAKVPSAQQRWSRCSESELLRCKGDRLQLAGLVQRRYGLTGSAAAQEVQSFLEERRLI